MKSTIKSDCLKLIESIYIDASMKCTADVFDFRDLITIRSRVEKEGLSFLTITLPSFCTDFERSLEQGFVDPAFFMKFHRNGELPAFLRGFLGQVFDVKTGELYNERKPPIQLGVDIHDIPTVIESVRQICCTFKKVELPCSEKRIKKAMDSYVHVEAQLSTFRLQEDETTKFLAVSDVLWHNILAGIKPADCIPRHGPGATAERISGNKKYVWREWYDRLEPYFPLVDSAFPIGIDVDARELKGVKIIPPEKERPVRVIHVPKTLKAPRIIAIEPVCMQYAQQGIRDALYRVLESSKLTKDHINFSDQSFNQKIALTSSKDLRYATIDLSDASDRVPRLLALQMFRSNPDLMDAIDACRSTHAELSNGLIIGPLHKFASMGSALCFPVEAMYFYTICVIALLDAHELSYTWRNIRKVARHLYVYGDDIIVPTTNAVIVLDYLQKYNCKVNINKTFVTGRFRESCGVDAYDGYEVTPTYLRTLRPRHKRDSSGILSWAATAHQLYKKGYWRTTTLIYEILERLIGSLPYVLETSPAVGRISFLGFESAERWSSELHRFEVLAMVPEPIFRTDRLEGYGALMKCLLKLEGRKSEIRPIKGWATSLRESQRLALFGEAQDKQHLRLTALHGGVALNRRWVLAH